MRIAIVGTGIAGNVAAYKLRKEHDITVYEASSYVGGHTNTVDVAEHDRTIAIDTGFIVFNDRTYPNFIGLLDEIGQESQASVMSFSVSSGDGGLEYNGAGLNALFAQRRNILRPPFFRMIRDILRFNREAMAAAPLEDDGQTVGEYLLRHGYGREFMNDYLVPMAAAIWSSEPVAIKDMPLQFLVRFFDHHGLLQLKDRPVWRVIKGGSREYVKKLVAGHRDRIRLDSPVRRIIRHSTGVEIVTDRHGTEWYDAVFLACHSDQALTMLDKPTPVEREVLGAIHYQDNEAVLHTDESVLPKRRRAWAAWNYHIPKDPHRHVAVTYNMNMLQGLDCDEQYCVTLNNDRQIDPAKMIKRIQYQHPVFSRDAVVAQRRQEELNSERTYFCGAYWRNGFHEDGVVSALHAVAHFEGRQSRGELHLRRAG
ncbi:MAG: FAD-dependent oxidoreductase [Gammaproteobacteria bacterium]|jgi:predicted NAD/FAD-binding protein|nr:FAD-dependent oxidoreductase [Gammaproteobacteria bacterium]MDH3905299.1 FAD-dependent oxidoreductase [Gammaproteobacteria bacterium]MDH3907711.1 FAD-dependent oxidoreductase [Gammaproteobacteria bacterium]MDH4004251.1 FAD-dependent oxidoreductase [Gammaproteobacteria bacterium]NCF59504.1 NAD(P)-binding protein [Gammaproteobacteria bacterium]